MKVGLLVGGWNGWVGCVEIVGVERGGLIFVGCVGIGGEGGVGG